MTRTVGPVEFVRSGHPAPLRSAVPLTWSFGRVTALDLATVHAMRIVRILVAAVRRERDESPAPGVDAV